MRCTAALLTLFLGAAHAAGPVAVQVEAAPGLTFSRKAPSTVTLNTPWGHQTARLNRGAPYRPDAPHYWERLYPLRLSVRVPAGTAAGRYAVSASTEFYVCDQTAHLCTVRPAEGVGLLEVGTRAVPLTLMLRVPKLGGF